MKRFVCAAALMAMLVGMSGCFISVNDGCKSQKEFKGEPMDPAIAEIDAVKMLSDDGARFDILVAIAQRPHLSPQARTHLAQSVNLLSDDGARYDVLMALARNVPTPPPPQPPFAPEAPLAPRAPQPPQPPANP